MRASLIHGGKALLLVLLSALPWYTAHAGDDAWAGETRVALDGESILYRGELTQAGNAKVAALLASHQDVEEIAIASPGGSIDLGLDLGDLVISHGLDVRVMPPYCNSSCANYVFPAGRRKIIEQGAVVIWHGSAIQEGLFDVDNIELDMEGGPDNPNVLQRWYMRHLLKRKVKRYASRVRTRQAAFYRQLGVDERITIIGQDLGCHCNWTLLPEDMAAFGITSVKTDPDYGTSRAAEDIKWLLVRLDEHPGYLQQDRK